MEQATESSLIERIKIGDRSAMADLYRRYIGYMTAACSRYVPEDEDLKDILQTSFVRIFTAIGKFQQRGEGSLRAWMTRIAVNEAINHLKRTSRLVPLDDTSPSGNGYTLSNPSPSGNEYTLSDTSPSGNEHAPDLDSIPAEAIQAIIKTLPDGYRTVFNLFVFEEMSHRQIASLLGISESTSASQFHRARKILAKKINEWIKENER